MSNIRNLLTVTDVAEACNVRPKTVYGWISTGKLRAYKLGGSIRVAEADLERFLAGSVLVTESDQVVRPTVPAPDQGRGASRLAVHPLLKPRRA